MDGQQVAKLMAVLGLDSSGFHSGINQVTAQSQTAGKAVSEAFNSSARNGVQSMENMANSMTSSLFNLRNTFLAVGTTLVGGFGLTSIVKDAVDAGDSMYKLATRFNLSTGQAAKLNDEFKLAGSNAQLVMRTMMNLDRQVEKSSKTESMAVQALNFFGVSLKDTNGKLLPMDQQLSALAKGFKTAAASGQEMEFVMATLGPRGQMLVPLLQDFEDYQEAASKLTGSGLDIKGLHEQKIELMALEMQWGKLKLAVTSALVPLLQEYLPKAMSLMSEWTKSWKDNKEEINRHIQALLNVGSTIYNAVSPAVREIMDFVVNHGELVKTAIYGIVAAVVTFKAVAVFTAIYDGLMALVGAAALVEGGFFGMTAATAAADAKAVGLYNTLMRIASIGAIMIPITLVVAAIGGAAHLLTDQGRRQAVQYGAGGPDSFIPNVDGNEGDGDLNKDVDSETQSGLSQLGRSQKRIAAEAKDNQNNGEKEQDNGNGIGQFTPTSGAGGGGEKGKEEQLTKKAEQLTKQINKEWAQLTQSEIIMVDEWRSEQIKALDEVAAENENDAADRKKVEEIYARKVKDINDKLQKDIRTVAEETQSLQAQISGDGFAVQKANLDKNTMEENAAYQDKHDKMTKEGATSADLANLEKSHLLQLLAFQKNYVDSCIAEYNKLYQQRLAQIDYIAAKERLSAETVGALRAQAAQDDLINQQKIINDPNSSPDKKIEAERQYIADMNVLYQEDAYNRVTASSEAVRQLEQQRTDYAKIMVDTFNSIHGSYTSHIEKMVTGAEGLVAGIKGIFSEISQSVAKMWINSIVEENITPKVKTAFEGYISQNEPGANKKDASTATSLIDKLGGSTSNATALFTTTIANATVALQQFIFALNGSSSGGSGGGLISGLLGGLSSGGGGTVLFDMGISYDGPHGWLSEIASAEGYSSGGLGSGVVLVGEDGPELVDAGGAGSRIYNTLETQNFMAKGGGYSGNPFTMNVYANDANSFQSSRGSVMREYARGLQIASRRNG